MFQRTVIGKRQFQMYQILFLSSVFFCQGCVVLTYGTFSEPIVSPKEGAIVSNEGIHWYGRYFGDTIQVREVALTVLPRNERVWFGVLGIIVPFLPLPGNDNLSESYSSRQNRGPLFVMRLTLNPKAGDFAFDPTRVSLSLPSEAELYPSVFWGPQSNRGNPDTDCSPFIYFDSKIPETIVTAETIAHMEIREETCFTYLFNTAPPSPDQDFFISITGIRKAGQMFTVPPIRF